MKNKLAKEELVKKLLNQPPPVYETFAHHEDFLYKEFELTDVDRSPTLNLETREKIAAEKNEARLNSKKDLFDLILAEFKKDMNEKTVVNFLNQVISLKGDRKVDRHIYDSMKIFVQNDVEVKYLMLTKKEWIRFSKNFKHIALEGINDVK